MKSELRGVLSSEQRKFFQARREALIGRLGAVPSVLVVASSPDASPPYNMVTAYRPDQSLAYLSGLDEPASAAVFISNGPVQRSLLFKKDRDLQFELWNGPMLSLQDAHEQLGFDHVYALGELERELAQALSDAEILYFEDSGDSELTRIVDQSIARSRARRVGLEVRESRHLLASLRLCKDDLELDALSKASQITAAGHEAAMKAARPGVAEFELQAEVEYAFRRAGAQGTGYPSIVAAGSNACCLHYNVNSCRAAEGDLVLIDAGAQYAGYTADVTRTFPVTGQFSREQALIYDIVLDAQNACIARAKPGESHQSLQMCAIERMCSALYDAGILDREPKECQETEDYKRFYPHNLGHWLGRDVHDVGTAKVGARPVHFVAGHVITIEPGLYFQLHDERIPEAYRGIGVRIEDNIVITESGCRNLTTAVKARGEVESMVQKMNV